MTTAKETVQLIDLQRGLSLIGAECFVDLEAGYLPDHPGHVCVEEISEYLAWETAMRPTDDTAQAAIIRATYSALRRLAAHAWNDGHPDPAVLERAEEKYLQVHLG